MELKFQGSIMKFKAEGRGHKRVLLYSFVTYTPLFDG